MKDLCIYPGTFSPPTNGHLSIVRRAAASFARVVIVCSANKDKRPLFSMEEAKRLWGAYPLPENAAVMTFDELRSLKADPASIVMIRGVRDADDIAHEGRVAVENHRTFGISRYHIIIAAEADRRVSSTAARDAAERLDLRTLGSFVAPRVVTALLERMLGIENLYLVVGRPAAGKSTVLRHLHALDARYVPIDTDRFLDDTKPLLKKRFQTEDLAALAIHRGDELKAAVSELWLARLREALRALPKRCDALVEVPYALQPDMALYRLLGGKVIQFGCKDDAEHEHRIIARGTPEHLPFLRRIPGWEEADAIASRHGLLVRRVVTDGDAREVARRLHEELSNERSTS